MKDSTKPLLWIVLALVLIAVGYVGFGMYKQYHDRQVEQGSQAPSQPQ